jgi:hypothetical protein
MGGASVSWLQAVNREKKRLKSRHRGTVVLLKPTSTAIARLTPSSAFKNYGNCEVVMGETLAGLSILSQFVV